MTNQSSMSQHLVGPILQIVIVPLGQSSLGGSSEHFIRFYLALRPIIINILISCISLAGTVL